MNADWCADQNVAAINNELKVFLCPSTPSLNRQDSTGMEGPLAGWGVSTFAITGAGGAPPHYPAPLTDPPGYCSDYWGINSVNDNVVVTFPQAFAPSVAAYAAANQGATTLDFYPPATGVLTRGENGLTHISDITDGTSNTILLTEVAGRPNQYGIGNTPLGTLAPGRGAGPTPTANSRSRAPMPTRWPRADPSPSRPACSTRPTGHSIPAP